MSDFIPFALPDIGEEEIAEVVDSLRSGWITTGPKTRRFEQEFAEFLGGDGAAALDVAARALRQADGAERQAHRPPRAPMRQFHQFQHLGDAAAAGCSSSPGNFIAQSLTHTS